MNKYVKKTYLTFGEVISLILDYPNFRPEQYNNPLTFDTVSFFMTALSVFLNGDSSDFDSWVYQKNKCCVYITDESHWALQDEIKPFFEMLVERFFNQYCIEVENFDTTNVYRAITNWITRLSILINNTWNKYLSLLTSYEALKNKLIDGKESGYTSETDTSANGTNRFNDTPQNSGLFDDDSHTSSLNESESSGSSDTEVHNFANDLYNVEKLRMLEEKFIDVYLTWTNEVGKKLFFTLSYE